MAKYKKRDVYLVPLANAILKLTSKEYQADLKTVIDAGLDTIYPNKRGKGNLRLDELEELGEAVSNALEDEGIVIRSF